MHFSQFTHHSIQMILLHYEDRLVFEIADQLSLSNLLVKNYDPNKTGLIIDWWKSMTNNYHYHTANDLFSN